MVKQNEFNECKILPLEDIFDNAKKLSVDKYEIINYYVYQTTRENILIKLTTNDVKFIDGMAIFIDLKLEMSPGFYNYLISDDYKKREKLFLETNPKHIAGTPLFLDKNGRKLNHQMLQELLFDVCIDPSVVNSLSSSNTKSLISRKSIIDEHIRYINHNALINMRTHMKLL